MPEEPRELAANEWGTITYHPEWNTLELTWDPAAAAPGAVEQGGVPAPDGPATFPTAWFETRDRLYAWLTSGDAA
jgi:hypothetical protein